VFLFLREAPPSPPPPGCFKTFVGELCFFFSFFPFSVACSGEHCITHAPASCVLLLSLPSSFFFSGRRIGGFCPFSLLPSAQLLSLSAALPNHAATDYVSFHCAKGPSTPTTISLYTLPSFFAPVSRTRLESGLRFTTAFGRDS